VVFVCQALTMFSVVSLQRGKVPYYKCYIVLFVCSCLSSFMTNNRAHPDKTTNSKDPEEGRPANRPSGDAGNPPQLRRSAQTSLPFHPEQYTVSQPSSSPAFASLARAISAIIPPRPLSRLLCLPSSFTTVVSDKLPHWLCTL
jgi:hypothetical protein